MSGRTIRSRLRSCAWLVVGLTVLSANAYAYIGPGAGITAIATVLALLAAILAAVFGFIWFPLKRMLGKRRRPDESSSTEPDSKEKDITSTDSDLEAGEIESKTNSQHS